MENGYKFKCETCGNPMVKAGKNSTGKQRYKCPTCKARQVIKKTKSAKKNELKLFVKWITDSTKAFDKIKLSRRTFHRKTKWCWNIVPQISPAANASKYILVDATYINRKLVDNIQEAYNKHKGDPVKKKQLEEKFNQAMSDMMESLD